MAALCVMSSINQKISSTYKPIARLRESFGINHVLRSVKKLGTESKHCARKASLAVSLIATLNATHQMLAFRNH